MWHATVQCDLCNDTHVVCCRDDAMPRAFAYVCPVTAERSAIRFHDPSRLLVEWTMTGERPPGALLVEDSSPRGAFEI